MRQSAHNRTRAYSNHLRHSVHFSSDSDKWETPPPLFNRLNEEFGFDLDAAALPENAKCERFFTPEEDGLSQDWHGVVWLNPPYGRTIGKWVQKAYEESIRNGVIVVCLLPARPDTAYWHSWVFPYAHEIRWIKGRLKFSGSKNSAPFPSAIVVFRPPCRNSTKE